MTPEFLPELPWPGLDRLGVLQTLGGLAVSLIALFSSYDHITLFGRRFPLQQQWGILFIAASLATVLIDAQLASRSRFRDAATRRVDRDREDQERDRTDQERERADQERDRADQERDRAAEARERQAESLERQNEDLALLRRSALLSAGVLLEPSATNRDRLRQFLAQVSQRQLEDPDG